MPRLIDIFMMLLVRDASRMAVYLGTIENPIGDLRAK
jgi:hypothetical protein